MANEVLNANKAGSLWLSPELLEQFRQISQTERGEIVLSDQATAELGVSIIVLDPHLVPLLSMLAKSSMANQWPESRTRGAFSDSAIHRLVGVGFHKQGRAVDISRHAGFRINVFQQDEALKGVVSLIGALPRGFYALGLPRLPADPLTNPEQARKDFEQRSRFNFYEGSNYVAGHLPLPELRPEWKSHSNMFLDRTLPVDRWPPNNAPLEQKIYFELEHIEDPQAKQQLIDAIRKAETRGVFIVHVFPNGVDHVDVSVGDDRESFDSRG
jgi:hypothetical protein